ncbi:MAG: bleomycin resistance protein [Muricauda sp.]|nr:VOC family protein [Allomuricauda sp.]MAU27438.1 bleomycin resistance protein [Allomuricauda sp.]MBC29539.1 bleomycin resistance protein [Allomuricauda sp.]|tara:strand:- start:203 stop:619 length:417 start_codon:yes stop_codon:yes gene_type:complete
MKNKPFHLSLPCKGIQKTEEFYCGLLGASKGRHTSFWIDINLFGNQITFTKIPDFQFSVRPYKFEDVVLPSFHFGVVLNSKEWEEMYGRIARSGIKPSIQMEFLKGKTGEHESFFLEDPNGHMVEFKKFANDDHIFKI